MKKRSKISKKSQSKSARGSAKSSPRISHHHREILWRPHRLQYLMEKHKGDCVFCSSIAKGISQESLVLWKSELVFIIMNKFPYNNGHLLVLPRRHVADLEDLTRDEFDQLHLAIRQSINALRKSYSKGPDGFNVGLNLGRSAGAGLPGHLHYHVVPRWVGDSNFFPIIGGTKVISENLEQTYQRLLPCFK